MLGISIVEELLIYQGFLELPFTLGLKHTLHNYLNTNTTKNLIVSLLCWTTILDFCNANIPSFIKQAHAACGTKGTNI